MSLKNLYMKLYNLGREIQATPIGYKMLYLIFDLEIYTSVRAFFNKRKALSEMINPTKEMMESRDFFKANSDRVSKILSCLADEESKECLGKMIDFRCYKNPDNFPPLTSHKKVYFGCDIFSYGKHEILVDCGAFTGDTIISFKKALSKYGGGYDKIISFEPDSVGYNILMLNKYKHKNVTTFNCGVWDSDTTLYFAPRMEASRSTDDEKLISDEQSFTKIPVKAIDNCKECYDTTIIKMDIEGAELPALKGAEKTILRNKPKLAICIYHSDEDMLRIAEWVHDKIPEYKLYVRQHLNYAIDEIVLYATL